MSSCPTCGAAIDGDAFGLITCSSCKSVLSVDLDGNATQVEHEPLPVEQEFSPPPIIPEPEPPREETSENFAFEEPVPEPMPDQEIQFESPPVFQYETSEEPAQEMPSTFEVPEPTTQNSFQLQGFQEPLPRAQGPLSVFKEIAEFASSPATLSLLSYSIFIEGLEHQKSEVLAALSEKKLGWSKYELESEMKGNRLVLRKLNPAQAVMVVKLLQNIPVRISWRQDGY